MKKIAYLSLACAALLQAAEVQLDPISIDATVISDVSKEEIKSADMAEVLARKVPSITLVRRSGIANDIILRGQKKDNINIIVDGTKVCGACPNRMDPPTSHIVTHNVESVKIIEGPYDVEHFGTLSGGVYVTTTKPTEEFHGDININMGSWNYEKLSATATGGTGMFKFLLGASYESSDQYKDGDGNTFADQVDNFIKNSSNPAAVAGTAYLPEYRDMKAFTKKSFMGKVFVDFTEDQELRLEYTRNESDDVLYPSSKMDAILDDSNIYNVQYAIKNIGSFSKELSAQYYHTDVDHPMSIRYRKASIVKGDITSALTTDVDGLSLKNITDITDTMEFTLGLDASRRNWDGIYTKNGNPMLYPPTSPSAGQIKTSIPDADTDNAAIFLEFAQNVGNFEYKIGARYDDTTIKPAAGDPENDYSAFSANIFGTYTATDSMKIFGGVGKASRVPDGRELYWRSSMGVQAGTPNLDQTTNYEVDLGMENSYESFTIKTKVFYSMLKDYIYYNSDNTKTTPLGQAAFHSFQNIDASIYGLDIVASYYASDSVYFDFGLAYQRGKKDEALTNSDGTKQTNTNLAEIPPLKGNIAMNFEYTPESFFKMEVVASDKWSDFDSDNGEQAIAGWGILNMKIDHNFNNGFGLALGADNLFDNTYAISNTYQDLILISDGTNDPIMKMNEPGRYFYVNASYTF